MDILKDSRKAYEQNAKNQMQKWEADLEEITNRSKMINTPETEAEYSRQIKELSSMLMASKEKVEALLNSPTTTWENEKVNFEKHWSHTALSFYKVKRNLPD